MFQAVGAVITAVLKVGVPIYVAVFIASCLALFLPDAFAQQIGIAAFRQSYRAYFGGSFIASLSLLAATGLSASSRVVKNRLNDRQIRIRTLETLKMLTEEEKTFLRRFIVNGQNTVFTPINDGVAGGLHAKKIIYRASNFIEHFSAPYNLQPIVRKLLSEKTELLK